jgi:hypothetical protein
MSKCLLIILLLLVSAGLSCHSPNDSEIVPSSPDMSQPIVTGIYITNAFGPDPIGVWGNPSDGSSTVSVSYPNFSIADGVSHPVDSPLRKAGAVSPGVLTTSLKLDNPYPNPFNGGVVISFSIPTTSKVELFVVPARLADDLSYDICSYSGAIAASPLRTAIAILVFEPKTAGMFVCNWNSRDQNGNVLPDGFYRIYLRVNNMVCWHDVLLANDVASLPPGLRR